MVPRRKLRSPPSYSESTPTPLPSPNCRKEEKKERKEEEKEIHGMENGKHQSDFVVCL